MEVTMLYQLAALTAEGAIPVIHSSDVSLLKELGNRFLSDLTLHRAGKQLTDFVIGECQNDKVSYTFSIKCGSTWMPISE